MKKFRLLSFLLTVLALVFGADLSMAAAPTEAGVNDPIKRDADPDDKNLNTDLSGTPATEKTVKDSDINDDEIDELVVKFRPFNYTFTTDVEDLARQKQVKDYTVKHPVMATPIMDCTNLATISSLSTAQTLTLTIGTNVTAAQARMFGKSQTFLAKGIPGYKGTTKDGELELKVVSRNSDGILCVPVNGYQSGSNPMYVYGDDNNAIPSGTKFQMMATACHTAQLVVSPKNQTPVFVDANLQKKIMNTTIEKEWKVKKKSVPYFTDDIADNAMMTFRQENERTKIAGAGGMLVESDDILGNLNCYYEEGVITQLLMKYVTNGSLTYSDIISISKMQFGKWSASNVAEVYCSYGFIEQLLNLDFTKVAQTNVMATQTKYGVDITEFKTTFGTLRFKLCPILDEMGFENCAMVIDMKNAIHYWKKPNVGEKSKEDLSKGGVEPVEADRDRYIKIDCLCLRGYNSILVGPADKIYGIDTQYSNRTDIYTFSNHVGSYYYTLSKLASNGNGSSAATPKMWVGGGETTDPYDSPASWADGMLVYLATADDNTGGTGFAAGTIAQWDAATSTWNKYSGAITA